MGQSESYIAPQVKRNKTVVHCKWGAECRSYQKGKCTKYAHNFLDPNYSQNIYVLLHGTSQQNLEKIQREGFKQTYDSKLGTGVYFTRNIKKAKLNGHRIIVAKVKVGKVKVIDGQHHPSQNSWHKEGFDSAYIPEFTNFSCYGFSELCVYDPSNIEIINILDHADFN